MRVHSRRGPGGALGKSRAAAFPTRHLLAVARRRGFDAPGGLHEFAQFLGRALFCCVPERSWRE